AAGGGGGAGRGGGRGTGPGGGGLVGMTDLLARAGTCPTKNPSCQALRGGASVLTDALAEYENSMHGQDGTSRLLVASTSRDDNPTYWEAPSLPGVCPLSGTCLPLSGTPTLARHRRRRRSANARTAAGTRREPCPR